MKNISDQKKIEYVNIAALVAMASAIGLTVAVNYLPALRDFISSNIVLDSGVAELVTALPFIVFCFICGTKVTKEFSIKKMASGNYILSIVLAFLFRPLLNFLNMFSLCFTKNALTDSMITMVNTVPFPLALISTAVIPAVVEEFICRGGLYHTYKKANPIRAVFFSSLIFGLLHRNLNQFLYTFVLGIIFCLALEATGSMVSGVLMHLTINATAVISAYMLPLLYDFAKATGELYEQMGMPEMMDMLEQYMGDMSVGREEWFANLMKVADTVDISGGFVFVNYLPSAVLFTVLGGLVLKAMAKNGKNYEHFRVTFLGAEPVAVEKEVKGPYDTETVTVEEPQGDSFLKIMTVPLLVTLVIGGLFIFVLQTLQMLPRFK